MTDIDDFMIVDTDFHFSEDWKQLPEYYDEPWRTRMKEGGLFSWVTFYPMSSGDTRMGGRIQRETDGEPMEIDEVPDAMDEIGVDKALLLSNLSLRMQDAHAENDRSVTMTNGIVDYYLDHVLDPDAGLYSAIPVPYQHPEKAVELIDRVGDHPGFVGVYIISGEVEPPLGDRKYEPIYAAAEEADLPIIFHGAGSSLDSFHRKGYSKFVSTHALGFMEANMEHLTSLLIQGIPEKFPDLELVFMESGLAWVPTMMHRLDIEYLKRPSEAPLLDKRPSEYMRENMYFGTQPLEQPEDLSHLEYIFDVIGPEQIMYSSDYPHWDFDHPRSIIDLPFLSREEKERILSKNAEEVFDI